MDAGDELSSGLTGDKCVCVSCVLGQHNLQVEGNALASKHKMLMDSGLVIL